MDPVTRELLACQPGFLPLRKVAGQWLAVVHRPIGSPSQVLSALSFSSCLFLSQSVPHKTTNSWVLCSERSLELLMLGLRTPFVVNPLVRGSRVGVADMLVPRVVFLARGSCP